MHRKCVHQQIWLRSKHSNRPTMLATGLAYYQHIANMPKTNGSIKIEYLHCARCCKVQLRLSKLKYISDFRNGHAILATYVSQFYEIDNMNFVWLVVSGLRTLGWVNYCFTSNYYYRLNYCFILEVWITGQTRITTTIETNFESNVNESGKSIICLHKHMYMQ